MGMIRGKKMAKRLIPNFKYDKICNSNEGYWGSFQSLIKNYEIDESKKSDKLIFHVPSHKIWINDIESARFCLKTRNGFNDSSNYAVLGIIFPQTPTFTNDTPPYCVLFDIDNQSTSFSQNLVFAPVFVPVLESYYMNNAMADLCYLGNVCNASMDIEKTTSPFDRAAMILEILSKFDIKSASEDEQRLLLKLKNNATTLALNTLAQKRKNLYLKDLSSHLVRYKMERDILDYYDKSQELSLSNFIKFAEQQSVLVDEKTRKIENNKNGEKNEDLQQQIKNYKL